LSSAGEGKSFIPASQYVYVLIPRKGNITIWAKKKKKKKKKKKLFKKTQKRGGKFE
jgi:hypothetical protein